jgi:hypothetical protein
VCVCECAARVCACVCVCARECERVECTRATCYAHQRSRQGNNNAHARHVSVTVTLVPTAAVSSRPNIYGPESVATKQSPAAQSAHGELARAVKGLAVVVGPPRAAEDVNVLRIPTQGTRLESERASERTNERMNEREKEMAW